MTDDSKTPPPGGEESMSEPVDRRTRHDRRRGQRRQRRESVPEDRRKGGDRRQGPRRAARSMNQYDMEPDVLEFIQAINGFKQRTGRAFPSWSDVLTILKSLGYEKRD